MLSRSNITSLLLAAVAAAAHPGASAAQTATTDVRWTGWLGCWSSETDSVARASDAVSSNATCIVPVAGSSAVEALTIARGKIVARDRMDAQAPSHAINSQGCRGTESVDWSASGRRVYLRSDYVCGGATKGSSTTMFALAPGGEWLRIDNVRSGAGTVTTVDRRRPVAVLAAVSHDAAQSIGAQRLAITTARAAAAVPVTADEIVDASRRLDAGVVRSWLLATREAFDFSGDELATLTRADVPQSVLQALMVNSARSQVLAGAPADHDVDEYLRRPGFSPSNGQGISSGQQTYYPMTTMYVCPPAGCVQNVAPPYNAYSAYNAGSPPVEYVPYPVYYGTRFIETRRPYYPQQPMHAAPRQPLPPHVAPAGPVGRRP